MPQSEIQSLCEALIEGRIRTDQRDRLERLVLEDAVARRFYIEYLHQHAALNWLGGGSEDQAARLGTSGTITPFSRTARMQLFSFVHRNLSIALAASLLLAIGAIFLFRTSVSSSAIATLTDSKACKWEDGTLPTAPGARLTAGRLRLAEGMARIVFDPGTEVIVEGPADLELVSAQRCVLHSGRLVAKVPPAAIGFIVETPTAELKDFGTEFGVSVKDQQTADVQVFNGRVDARHLGTGKTEQMLTGRSLRFKQEGVRDFDPSSEQPPAASTSESGRVVQITTATGRGKDAYVQPLFPSVHWSTTLLLVKNCPPDKSDYFRKAYFAFDLAGLNGQKVRDAHLTLSFAPTGMGFASEVPDATFVVYGLIDDALDGWDEETMRWNDAPANESGGKDLTTTKVKLLGKFTLPQGVQSGAHGISGKALADFLNRDTNGIATLIVVRETAGSGRNDLVHGFANKDHPTLSSPTLKLVIQDR